MADAPLFSAQDLAVGYHGRALISGICAELERGQILTLIGPNGAGKSTVLKTVTRQLAPVGGRVYIDGKDLQSYAPAELARRMAVVLTERVRPEMMTCYEVAAMGRYPHTGRFGALTPHDHAVVREALCRVRAEDIADQDFERVSDGQRQRVLLARALCQEPELLVLDEPTSFLDIRHKIDLLDILLEEARSRGVTVILSLHEIDLAEKISDLVMCLKGDTVWKLGPPETVFSDSQIAALYDLERGSYLTGRGSVELSRPEGEPRVFVLGGGGSGLSWYRLLQKRRIPFLAGILQENDIEYPVARALAVRVISQGAFEPLSPDTLATARQCLLACGAVIDTGAPCPVYAALLEEARRSGIKIIRSAHELD